MFWVSSDDGYVNVEFHQVRENKLLDSAFLAHEAFTKHFFAHDKINYARMVPVYLVDIKSVESEKISNGME